METPGWVVNAAPLAPPTGCVKTANCVGAPAVPVAVIVTGEPLNPADVARSVFTPAVVPNVHAGLLATPELSVVTTPLDPSVPEPGLNSKVTATPLTALPCASVTFTDGAVPNTVPTVALCEAPPFTANCVAAPTPTVTFAESATANGGVELNRST
jgi:hypothetical protein